MAGRDLPKVEIGVRFSVLAHIQIPCARRVCKHHLIRWCLLLGLCVCGRARISCDRDTSTNLYDIIQVIELHLII